MTLNAPLLDDELFEIESLACDLAAGPLSAGDGPWMDEDEVRARFAAAIDPEVALRLVREIRRLRRMEERYTHLCGVLEQLNLFLERRGLVAQAERFVQVRHHLACIHADADPAPAFSVA
jgi:hypothetical protein